MNKENPYAAPETDPIPTQPFNGQLQLATPSERFTGAIIDGLLGLVTIIPIWGAFYFLGVIKSMEDFEELSFGYDSLLTVLYFALFVAIQWKFLKETGQTIGKKVAKTRIVTMEGNKPKINDLLFKRYAFVNLISLIPVVGGIVSLVDVLLVFKKDRRCLHDMIAGTQVVKFPPGQTIS